MAAKSVIQFVLGQFAKRSARNTGIPKILNANDSIVQSNALSIEKTLKNYDIKISERLEEILKFYKKGKFKNEFIFPIISRENAEHQYLDVIRKRKEYNADLKKVANLCNIEYNLTSYVSRHSFATNAMLQEIPLQAISAMLGHSKLNTTQIYLKSLPNEILDTYNQRISVF